MAVYVFFTLAKVRAEGASQLFQGPWFQFLRHWMLLHSEQENPNTFKTGALFWRCLRYWGARPVLGTSAGHLWDGTAVRCLYRGVWTLSDLLDFPIVHNASNAIVPVGCCKIIPKDSLFSCLLVWFSPGLCKSAVGNYTPFSPAITVWTCDKSGRGEEQSSFLTVS